MIGWTSPAQLRSSARPRDTIDAPKLRRSRAFALSHVNRNTRLGKRIDALRAIFVAALGGAEAISPLKRIKIDDAAQLKAIAEKARGDWMRNAAGSLDDIVRAERKADQAIRALGIVEGQPKPPSVAEYLASRQTGK